MFDTTQFLKSQALKWSTKHPGQSTRIYKGLDIALAGKVAPRNASSFRVVGSKGAEYTVTVTNGYPACTCKDHQHRGRCYHTWACALVTRLAQEIEETLSMPTPPAAMAAKGVAA